MARGPYEDDPQRVTVALLSSGPTVEATLGVAAGLGVRKGENPAAICSLLIIGNQVKGDTPPVQSREFERTGGSLLGCCALGGVPSVEGEQGTASQCKAS